MGGILVPGALVGEALHLLGSVSVSPHAMSALASEYRHSVPFHAQANAVGLLPGGRACHPPASVGGINGGCGLMARAPGCGPGSTSSILVGHPDAPEAHRGLLDKGHMAMSGFEPRPGRQLSRLRRRGVAQWAEPRDCTRETAVRFRTPRFLRAEKAP